MDAKSSAGRPAIGTPEAVRRVVRDLEREERGALTLAEWRDELMRRLSCSRRTAYRAVSRAIAARVLRDADADSDTA
jgi:hypothetical protein